MHLLDRQHTALRSQTQFFGTGQLTYTIGTAAEDPKDWYHPYTPQQFRSSERDDFWGLVP